MTGETERPPATRPPHEGLYRPRRYAAGRSIEEEPVTLDHERPPGNSAPLASLVLILAWLGVWSIDVRNPIPAFAGFVLGFVVLVIFPHERIAFAHLGRRLILLPAALALPVTYVLLRARGVDSILDTPIVLMLVLLLTPLVLVLVHTRERGTAPIPLLTLALMLALPVAVIGYGIVEQRYVGAEHEPRIIDDPSLHRVFGIGSIGGSIESVTSEAERASGVAAHRQRGGRDNAGVAVGGLRNAARHHDSAESAACAGTCRLLQRWRGAAGIVAAVG